MEICHLLVYSFQNLFWHVTAYRNWWGLSTFQIFFIIYIFPCEMCDIILKEDLLDSSSDQFSLVLSHVWLFATPWTAYQASTSITNSQSVLKLMSIMSVMSSNHLTLCYPLLLLPSIFPSIRIFSNEAVLRIRWSKYWSFSFSIRPSKEYSGLISFRIDWFDLLAVQRTLKNLL